MLVLIGVYCFHDTSFLCLNFFLIMYSRIRTINVSMFIWESVAIGFDFWRYCEYKFILLFGIVHMAHHAVVPWPTELTWMNQFFIVVPRRGFTQKPHWHGWLSYLHGWLFTSMGGCLTSMGSCLTGIGGCLTSMGGCFTGICGYLTNMGGSLTGIGGCLREAAKKKSSSTSGRATKALPPTPPRA